MKPTTLQFHSWVYTSYPQIENKQLPSDSSMGRPVHTHTPKYENPKKRHKPPPHPTTWIHLTNIMENKEAKYKHCLINEYIHIRIKKQVKLIHAVRSLQSGRPCGVHGDLGRVRGPWGDNFLFLDLGAGYMGMFALWKFLELYIYDLFTSLYVCYISIVFWKKLSCSKISFSKKRA